MGLRWGWILMARFWLERRIKRLSLQGVNLRVSVVDSLGRQRTYDRRISVLAPNQATTLATGVAAGSGQVQVVVTAIQQVFGG